MLINTFNLLIVTVLLTLFSVFMIVAIIFFIRKNRYQIGEYRKKISDKQVECEKQAITIQHLQENNNSLTQSVSDIQNRYKLHLDRLKPEFKKILEQLKNSQMQKHEIYLKYQFNAETTKKITNENAILHEQLQLLSEKVTNLHSIHQDDLTELDKDLYPENLPAIYTSGATDILLEKLSALLDQLQLSPYVKAAAIADQIGLVVAETGPREFTEGLAGIAASIENLNYHVHSFIPFSDLGQIAITDTNKLTITAFPVIINNEALTIATLSDGPGPAQENVLQILSQILNNSDISSCEISESQTQNVAL